MGVRAGGGAAPPTKKGQGHRRAIADGIPGPGIAHRARRRATSRQNAYSAVTPSSAVERFGPSNSMPVAVSRTEPDFAR